MSWYFCPYVYSMKSLDFFWIGIIMLNSNICLFELSCPGLGETDSFSFSVLGQQSICMFSHCQKYMLLGVWADFQAKYFFCSLFAPCHPCCEFSCRWDGHKWYFNNFLTYIFLTFSSVFSELSLALNKEGLWLTKTDTQPERTLRWVTHPSQSWYTPLVEVNQAILAWSF